LFLIKNPAPRRVFVFQFTVPAAPAEPQEID